MATESKEIVKINPLKEMEAAVQSAKNIRELVRVEALSNRYVANYMAVSRCTEGEARAQFEMEALAFMEIVANKPDLNDCDPYSIFAGFVKAGVTGLSFRGGRLSIYKRGVKQKDNTWKQNLVVEPDAHGKKEMMERMPEIKRIDEGVVVYKDDAFIYSPVTKQVVKHEQAFPTPVASKDTVKAAYCSIHFADGHREDIVMSVAEIEIARSKSQQQNGMMWAGHYAEACKKTTYNRAFKVNYRMPKTAVIFNQYEVVEEEVTPVVEAPAQVEAPLVAAEVVDQDSGEVLTPVAETPPPPPAKEEKPKARKANPGKQESFIPEA